MRLVIATEERFDRTPDGAVWSTAQGHFGFWARYLDAFDEVAVAARVREVPDNGRAGARADGDGVSFIPIPYYLGPRQYARRYVHARRALHAAFGPDDAVLLRLPAQVATTMAPAVWRDGRPYGVEVVGDPYDVFAPGAVTHPLRPYFRWSYARAQRRQVARAAAVAYVTEHALQRRYPASDGAYTTHYSSVELGDDAFVDRPRPPRPAGEEMRLVTVGSFAHMYKGIDVLLRAVRHGLDRGQPVRLAIVGEGRHRPEMERLAADLGIAGSVDFVGQLPSSAAVRAELDRADLFVMASRTEGLPRAMIEAMARGLPCVGTTVGGIPELLPPACMVPPDDAEGLAGAVAAMLDAPDNRARAAARNLEKARAYRAEVLSARRREFGGALRERTEAWIAGRSR
jgi:glycosyltransferase involved in cell wall biosynthesis